MIFSFILFAIFLNSDYSTQDRSEYFSSKSDSLQGNVILGIDDLYRQSGLYFTSLDRMTSMFHTDLYGPYGPQPEFSLNGIPFNATFFGISYTQMIPLPLPLIHDVEYRSGLTTQPGYFFQHGVIDFSSAEPNNGLTLFGSGQYGHNGNEPGPWVFDPEKMSPNIERFGPWADAGIIYRSGSWYIKGVSRFHSYKNMHPFVQNRTINHRITPDQHKLPDVRISSSLLMAEAGISIQNSDLTFQYIRSELEDEHFFAPLSREVLTNLHSSQFSFAGKTRFNDQFKAHYLIQNLRTHTSELENRFGFHFDWKQSDKIINGSLIGSTSTFEAQIGSKLKLQNTDAPGLHNYNRNFVTLYANQIKKLNKKTELEAGQSITFHQNQPAYQVYWETTFNHTEKYASHLKVEYSELHPESAGTVDSYILSGYDLFDRLDIPSQLPNQISKTRNISFTGSHSSIFNPTFQLDLKIQFIHQYSFPIPFQQAQYNPNLSTMPGLYTLFDNESGNNLTLEFRSEHHPNQKFSQKWLLSHRSTLQATEQLGKYWEMTPRFLATYEAALKPFKDLEFLFVAHYRSVSRWYDFEMLDGEFARTFNDEAPSFNYPYSSIMPKHLMIHLGISKWFWNQRVRGTAMLKNLLNRPYQMHPIGTKEEFGYLVRVEMVF